PYTAKNKTRGSSIGTQSSISASKAVPCYHIFRPCFFYSEVYNFILVSFLDCCPSRLLYSKTVGISVTQYALSAFFCLVPCVCHRNMRYINGFYFRNNRNHTRNSIFSKSYPCIFSHAR